MHSYDQNNVVITGTQRDFLFMVGLYKVRTIGLSVARDFKEEAQSLKLTLSSSHGYESVNDFVFVASTYSIRTSI